MSNLYIDTKQIMKKYNVFANKSFGQNFLIDENIVNSIIEGASITKDDLIIEIGPGLGTLTNELLNLAGKVICIELDSNMVKVLKSRFALANNLEIIQDDILKIDLHSILAKELESYERIKVVANLPYYITTPIIMKLLEDKLPIESITIMIQKEVAERLLAKPGENLSGAITYAIYYYSNPQKIIDVSRDCFLPSPEVDSMVIKLNILNEAPIRVSNEDLFFKLIKQAFSQRRKTLLNTLTNFQGLSKQQIAEILTGLNIDLNIRGEKLTLQQYAELCERIENKV